MRTDTPNPDFDHVHRKLRREPVRTWPVFRDLDDYVMALVEGRLFADNSPEITHPELCPD